MLRMAVRALKNGRGPHLATEPMAQPLPAGGDVPLPQVPAQYLRKLAGQHSNEQMADDARQLVVVLYTLAGNRALI